MLYSALSKTDERFRLLDSNIRGENKRARIVVVGGQL